MKPDHPAWVTTLIMWSFLAPTGQVASAAAIPDPSVVPGKEYSDAPDSNTAGAGTPGQLLFWNGSGTVSEGPVAPPFPPPYWPFPGPNPYSPPEIQIDALASKNDPFFREVSFLNTATLLVSVKGDSALNSVWYETPDASRGVWATKAQINLGGVTDLDALELGGPDGASNSRVISLHDDGFYSIRTVGGTGIISDTWMARAIGIREGATINGVLLTADLMSGIYDKVQVDALMYEHRELNPSYPDYWNITDAYYLEPYPLQPLSWLYSDDILFSIEPITVQVGSTPFTLFDGGEVWTYRIPGIETNYEGPPARFLNHGGHLWDTAFDVRGAFGVQSEDIDALAAVGPVPETGSIAAAAVFGLLTVSEILRRRGSFPI